MVTAATFRRNTRGVAAERRLAAERFLHQGLVVVPMTSPWSQGHNPGKSPLRDPEKGGRAECRTLYEFEGYLLRVPDMNLAIMGTVQVDCDDAMAIAKVKDLGVKREDRAWFVRSRKGWKAIYRPPARNDLVTHTKAGGIGLDFLWSNMVHVVPPSVHATGHHYTWFEGHGPTEIPFGKLQEPPILVQEYWALCCNPGPKYPSAQVPQGAGFDAALRGALAYRTKSGRLPSENADGWINGISCPFTENHAHGDRHPSFGVNFRIGAWKCFGACGSGSLVSLAEQLRVPIATVHRGRGGSLAASAPISAS